jgi:plasmid stabilization system protein ParE
MKRYTVTWLESARAHLAQIWVDASDRQAVTAAANTIDTDLARDPGNKGTAVSEGLRSLYVPPLHVLYSVREPDCLVEVASVRRDDKPSATPPANGNGQPTS